MNTKNGKKKSYTSFELEIDKIFLQYFFFPIVQFMLNREIYSIEFFPRLFDFKYLCCAQKKIIYAKELINFTYLSIISTLVHAANKQNRTL